MFIFDTLRDVQTKANIGLEDMIQSAQAILHPEVLLGAKQPQTITLTQGGGALGARAPFLHFILGGGHVYK